MVTVHGIKGIVKPCKLGNDDKNHSEQGQESGNLKSSGNLFHFSLCGEQVLQIKVKAVDDNQYQEKYKKITDAHGPPAQRTGITAENIGSAVGNQKKHGA